MMTIPPAALEYALAKAEMGQDLTEEETAAVALYNEAQAVKKALGPLASDNARENLTNRLLLALLESTTPDPADVAALRTAYDAVNASPALDAILAVAEDEISPADLTMAGEEAPE